MSISPPDLSLAGRRALVFGGSQGIGRAAAEALSSLGARLTLVARSEEKLRAVAESLPVPSEDPHGILVADLDDSNALRSTITDLISREGPHTIVINNSGGPAAGPIFDAAPEEFITAMTRLAPVVRLGVCSPRAVSA